MRSRRRPHLINPNLDALNVFTLNTLAFFSTSSIRSPPETSSLHVREDIPIPCIWCQLGSTTYIVINSFTQLHGDSIESVIQSTGVYLAICALEEQIHRLGDGLLTGGIFDRSFVGVSLRVANSNNHQLTRGVMHSALTALRSCMQSYNVWGSAAFGVYDGSHLVGHGTMSPR